jgi:hypothetical protein
VAGWRWSCSTLWASRRSAAPSSCAHWSLVAELTDHLVLVDPPPDDPDSHRIEWLWRALRRAVTHHHQRATFPVLLADADAWAAALTPNAVLLQIGSPFAQDPDSLQPLDDEEASPAA